MAFGAPAGNISKNTRSACQVADKIDNLGKITDQATYGGTIDISVEVFADAAGNAATSGQTGATVTTGDDFVESATDFAKKTTTTRTVNV